MFPRRNLGTHLLVRLQMPGRICPWHTKCTRRWNSLQSWSRMNRQHRGHKRLPLMLLGRKSMYPRHRRYNPLLLDCRLKLRTCQRRTRCTLQLSLPQVWASTFPIRSLGTSQLSWRQLTQNTCPYHSLRNHPLIGCLLCLETCQPHTRRRPPWNWLQ